MGKRPLRIHQRDIAQEAPKLVGQQAQVVMIDGLTHAGKLLACGNDALSIEDLNANWTHRKSHRHQLPFTEINYIVVDKISAW